MAGEAIDIEGLHEEHSNDHMSQRIPMATALQEGPPANHPAHQEGTRVLIAAPERIRRSTNLDTLPLSAMPAELPALFLIPFFIFLTNVAFLILTLSATDFGVEYTSLDEQMLFVVNSFPKHVNWSLFAMSVFGMIVAIYQIVTNPYSPCRPYYRYGLVSYYYALLFIWVIAEMTTYVSILYKARHKEFDGLQTLYASLGVTVIQILLIVWYMMLKNNPITRQRTRNAAPLEDPDAVQEPAPTISVYLSDRASYVNPQAAASNVQAQVQTNHSAHHSGSVTVSQRQSRSSQVQPGIETLYETAFKIPNAPVSAPLRLSSVASRAGTFAQHRRSQRYSSHTLTDQANSYNPNASQPSNCDLPAAAVPAPLRLPSNASRTAAHALRRSQRYSGYNATQQAQDYNNSGPIPSYDLPPVAVPAPLRLPVRASPGGAPNVEPHPAQRFSSYASPEQARDEDRHRREVLRRSY